MKRKASQHCKQALPGFLEFRTDSVGWEVRTRYTCLSGLCWTGHLKKVNVSHLLVGVCRSDSRLRTAFDQPARQAGKGDDLLSPQMNDASRGLEAHQDAFQACWGLIHFPPTPPIHLFRLLTDQQVIHVPPSSNAPFLHPRLLRCVLRANICLPSPATPPFSCRLKRSLGGGDPALLPRFLLLTARVDSR